MKECGMAVVSLLAALAMPSAELAGIVGAAVLAGLVWLWD